MRWHQQKSCLQETLGVTYALVTDFCAHVSFLWKKLFHRCKGKNNSGHLHIFVKTILKVRLNYFGKNLQEKLEQGDCTRETPEFPSYLSHSGSLEKQDA